MRLFFRWQRRVLALVAEPIEHAPKPVRALRLGLTEPGTSPFFGNFVEHCPGLKDAERGRRFLLGLSLLV